MEKTQNLARIYHIPSLQVLAERKSTITHIFCYNGAFILIKMVGNEKNCDCATKRARRCDNLGKYAVGGGLEALRSKYGDVQIEWFVDERFAEILRNSPCVAHLHALPFKKWLKSPRGIYKIWHYMRSCGEYDIAIDARIAKIRVSWQSLAREAVCRI